jgi:Leucine-rich repeat (LRR) protein
MDYVKYKGRIIETQGHTLYLNNLNIQTLDEIEGLEQLITLRKLYLENNQITEIKGLDTLKNLIWLNLENNMIIEIKGLDSLTKLTRLGLFKNQITEIKGLGKLIKLKNLILDKNEITEIKGLENLKNLTQLWLRDNHIAEIKGLENLTNLIWLYLDWNMITEIKGLDSLKNLKKLSLWGNQISKISDLHLPNLEEIYLESNQISKAEIKLWKKKFLKVKEPVIKKHLIYKKQYKDVPDIAITHISKLLITYYNSYLPGEKLKEVYSYKVNNFPVKFKSVPNNTRRDLTFIFNLKEIKTGFDEHDQWTIIGFTDVPSRFKEVDISSVFIREKNKTYEHRLFQIGDIHNLKREKSGQFSLIQ